MSNKAGEPTDIFAYKTESLSRVLWVRALPLQWPNPDASHLLVWVCIGSTQHSTVQVTGSDQSGPLIPLKSMILSKGRPLSQSVQFSSVAQSCLTLCDPMDCSTPGFSVHHQLPESAQTVVHGVGDAIQPSHSLSSPSPPAFNLYQHHSLFQWVSSLYQGAKVLEFQLQYQSFQWIFRTDFL